MKIVTVFQSLLLSAFLTTHVGAEGMDDGTEKALDETLDILMSPPQRKEIIEKDPKARQADDFALAVGGTPENQQKIYELSAQIMKELADKTGGSPDEMMKLLEQGQKDPEAFAKKFSPEQQRRIQELAKEIERTRGSQPLPALQ